MARDTAALLAAALKNLPWWLGERGPVEDAALRAIAAALATADGTVEGLHLQTFLAQAVGAWLDEHGFERSVARREGETDEEYRVRVRTIEDRVTRPAILAAANAILLVGQAVMHEHRIDGAYACEDGDPIGAFADDCFAYDLERFFTIYIDPQVADRSNRGWAMEDGTGSKLGFACEEGEGDVGAFADGHEGSGAEIYGQILREIDRLRAAGVGFQVVVGETL